MTDRPDDNQARHVERRFSGPRLLLGGAVVGVLGLALWIVALVVDPRHALLSYLATWTFAVFLAVGALTFLASGYAMSSGWTAAVRRITEAMTVALPLLMVGFVPIVVGAAHIYPWVHPDLTALSHHDSHRLLHKQAYLNLTFFTLRGLGYFVLWIALAWILRRWSRQREERAVRGEPVLEGTPDQRERNLSCAALPFIGITATFAAFDWLMSLEPLWQSTMFGLYVAVGGFLAGLAAITLCCYGAVRSGSLAGAIGGPHFHALGRTLLAFVILWAYCGYFQLMLIRIADLPSEVTYYLHRVDHGWLTIGYLLIVGHFAVPFAVLLMRSWKFNPGLMAAVSAWILVFCWLDCYWMAVPLANGNGAAPDWIDLGPAMAVLGFFVAFTAWRQRGQTLLPFGDPKLERGLAYYSDNI